MACCKVPHAPVSVTTRVCYGSTKTRRSAFGVDFQRRPRDLTFYLAPFPSRTYTNEQSSRGFCKPATSPASKELAGKRMAGPGLYLAGKREVKDITMTGSTPKEKIHLKGPFSLWSCSKPETLRIPPRFSFSFTTDDRYVTWIANRSKRFDQWCQDFLDPHQEPVTVLHLGCGLYCRYFRVEHRPENEVRWHDLDQLMVVDQWNRLIPSPVEGDYALRTLDVTNKGWFRNVPADRLTLIIAEGLMPYLEPEQGQKLIHDLVDYFGAPSTETDLRLTGYIKAPRTSKTAFKWGVDEPEQIQELHPRLALKDRVLWSEYMSSHPPFFGKYGTEAASAMPSFEKNIQFWRVDFKRLRRNYWKHCHCHLVYGGIRDKEQL
ncbi:putative S-adenosyl-L-methionine-dependent methyltransferase [Seiridium unicorne]|uniref:S-adenosyl-L-methionine-dependent methyltransferase n=1 Tax=Seiridium unicorne TaxID=138068 RepID=A0ABR2VC64_9PEZI